MTGIINMNRKTRSYVSKLLSKGIDAHIKVLDQIAEHYQIPKIENITSEKITSEKEIIDE